MLWISYVIFVTRILIISHTIIFYDKCKSMLIKQS